MTALVFIFILSAIGIGESIYLVTKRRAAEHPVCPIGGDCAAVLGSRYNRVFFIHNDVLGLVGNLLIAACAALLIIGWGPVNAFGFILEALVAFASVMSVFFVFLQWKIVKAWCSWCLLSAITIWLMAIIVWLGSLIY